MTEVLQFPFNVEPVASSTVVLDIVGIIPNNDSHKEIVDDQKNPFIMKKINDNKWFNKINILFVPSIDNLFVINTFNC